MMFSRIMESNYIYILEAEMLLLMKFKLNPFDIMNKITLTDLFSYMKNLENKLKKEHDSINKDDLTKSLISLRDILMFITLGKDGVRLKK